MSIACVRWQTYLTQPALRASSTVAESAGVVIRSTANLSACGYVSSVSLPLRCNTSLHTLLQALLLKQSLQEHKLPVRYMFLRAAPLPRRSDPAQATFTLSLLATLTQRALDGQ